MANFREIEQLEEHALCGLTEKLSYLVYLNEMHFRNLRSERIGLLRPSGCQFHPSGSIATFRDKHFIPWDKIQPSGCKTQFFLPVGYDIPH